MHHEIRKILKAAGKIVALTGAGISAESGVPTFRDAQTGLWERYSPHELATPEAFQRNPDLVWQWYSWRKSLINQAQPNNAHFALAAMEQIFPDFKLITQNVDGLHQKAGSGNILELHGNIYRTRCSQEGTLIDEWTSGEVIPPKCPNCGGFLRPDVVWFGEHLTAEVLDHAHEICSKADVLMSIGTSSIVQPAASLPYLALQNGASIIEINLEKTPLTPFTKKFLQGPAAQILPALLLESSE